jgi:hypothetical protein
VRDTGRPSLRRQLEIAHEADLNWAFLAQRAPEVFVSRRGLVDAIRVEQAAHAVRLARRPP